MNRKKFLNTIALGCVAAEAYPFVAGKQKVPANTYTGYEISLAEWSLHRTLRSGKISNLMFPSYTKETFGISAVEYVDQFFEEKENDKSYIRELKSRSEDVGVKNVLIMIDRSGSIAALAEKQRTKAIENHYRWVEVAKTLGCHSIRVNLISDGSSTDVSSSSVDGLSRLTAFAKQSGISVLVENHGGYSSDASWLADVIRQVDSPFCGTLPDLDNFCIKRGKSPSGERVCLQAYDRYQGTSELAPYAKGISAKTRGFDEFGFERNMDYSRLLAIIDQRKTTMFEGYIGIEYTGEKPSEEEGILLSKRLIERYIGEKKNK